jgi:hypothetical protein
MVGARRAIASRVGAAVVGGREMQAAADNRGQQCKLETIVTKKNLVQSIIRITCGIDAFARTIKQCRYRTVHCKIPYGTVPVLYYAKNRFNTHVLNTTDRTIKNED